MRGFASLLQSLSLLVPGWLVFNMGGGGGISTVHTDGVTIQGDGSSGDPIALLDAFTDGTSLEGAGLPGDKLRMVPTNFFTSGQSVSPIGTAGDFLTVYGFQNPTPVQFSNISCIIQNYDPSPSVQDFGIYSAAGDRICHTGPLSFTTESFVELPIVEGTVLMQPGLFLFAMTSTDSDIEIWGSTAGIAWFYSPFYSSSSGGTLPATIPPPPVTPAVQNLLFSLS